MNPARIESISTPQRVRDHAVYSARQRTIVLTFADRGAAEAFDGLQPRQVVDLLAAALDLAEANEP